MSFVSYVPYTYVDQAILCGWLPVGPANQSLEQTRMIMEYLCECRAPMPWSKQNTHPVTVPAGTITGPPDYVVAEIESSGHDDVTLGISQCQ